MTAFIWIIICISGLCWGSFLNVLIIRTLNRESIISPPSKCPKCSNKLPWKHKIPVLSFFLLKGRCKFCDAPISPQYPIIEISGMTIFIFAFSRFISLYDALVVIIILSMFLTLALTDFKEQKVNKIQTLIIIAAGIVFNRYNCLNSILGAITAAGIIILLIQTGLKIFKKETFGIGDIYLLAALGAVVGVDKLYIFLIYALIFQVIFIFPKYIMTLIYNKQFKTLKYLTFFTALCVFLYVLRNVSFWGAKALFIVLLTGILYYSFKLSKNFFELLKSDQTQSYCPIAPAIAFSCLLFLI
ncbi:MAG: prepilin peptidase [Candidatus Gastranaerophilales bacterium]|nr:prepilin peptidase [Candidatus Gastranaerophilales bacterium]